MSLIFSLDLKKPSTVTASPNDEIQLPGVRRKTVILLHGLTGTPNEMRFLAFYLNRHGYTTICPRLANHGEPLQVLKRTTWEQLYDSVRPVFLRALESGDEVYVAGLSMSALFVLLLAEEFGDKLAGGICLSPTLFFDGWNVPWYNRFLPIAAYTPLKYSFYFKESPPYGIKNQKVRDMVHRFYSQAKIEEVENVSKFGYAFFPVSLFHELRRLARRVMPSLEKIECPILLMHPREDDTASLKNSQLIYDGISSKIKRLVILDDSYHVITADQEREKVAAEILTFVSRDE